MSVVDGLLVAGQAARSVRVSLEGGEDGVVGTLVASPPPTVRRPCLPAALGGGRSGRGARRRDPRQPGGYTLCLSARKQNCGGPKAAGGAAAGQCPIPSRTLALAEPVPLQRGGGVGRTLSGGGVRALAEAVLSFALGARGVAVSVVLPILRGGPVCDRAPLDVQLAGEDRHRVAARWTRSPAAVTRTRPPLADSCAPTSSVRPRRWDQ